MELEKILTANGRSIDLITKLYHGLDHHCRCGCGGKYMERNADRSKMRGFTRALNTMLKPEFKALDEGKMMYARDGRSFKCEGIEFGENYVNIPYDGENDKCYTLYFD